MMIKSATAPYNDAESDLLTKLLHREQNYIAGARTFSMDDMRNIAEKLCSHRSNDVCDGSPSRIRMVRRISLEMTSWGNV